MVIGPLPDRLEYAILEIVMASADSTHQDSWGNWQNSVSPLVPDWVSSDLKSAFKRLWKDGLLSLLKYVEGRRAEYSGNEQDDDAFFLIGPFIATITDEGRRHWGVPVQREMERERSRSMSIPPLRGGDFQGIGVYRSDVFWGRARKANFRAQHRLDEPTKLSLGMVASQQ
jgi:hypothetical protein